MDGRTSSLYVITVLLSLDVSTHVTKSSICLGGSSVAVAALKEGRKKEDGPCYEVGRVGDSVRTDTNMTLFDEFDGL